MHRCRARAFITALAIALLSSGCSRSEGVIWYTASINGNLDGCTCVSRPRAGLVKSAAFVRAAPQREWILLLDAGDLCDGRDGGLAAELLEVCDGLGYDAIAAGDREVSLGTTLLRELAGRHPLLANNLSLRPDLVPPPPLSDGPLVLEKPWGRVAVVALLDPSTLEGYPPALRDAITIAPPEAAARVELARLAADPSALRVLLFHGSWEAAERLAASVAGFDLIVVGHDGGLHEPQRIGGAILASPGEEGNRVGMLELTIAGADAGRPRVTRLSGSFRLFRYATDPDDPEVRGRINGYREKLRVPTEAAAGTP
jgi:2',3'-cyclic-nucleotide 2'-phosphodiesterase (5'-nucleotidase family)